MKVLIFGGSGKMGAAVAWDLVRQDDVEAVGLVGRTEESLTRTREWVGGEKIRLHALDIHDVAAVAWDLVRQRPSFPIRQRLGLSFKSLLDPGSVTLCIDSGLCDDCNKLQRYCTS